MTEFEDLERRLRAADPAGAGRPVPDARVALDDLIEAVVAEPAPARGNRLPWLLVAAAIAGVLAVAAGFLVTRDGTDRPIAKTVADLALPPPAGPAGGTCIPFDPAVLPHMTVAFSGTAAEVSEREVLIDVDHWYRGGTADRVRLVAPADGTTADPNGVTFTGGTRYLVSGTEGVVSYCGYTDVWSAAKEQQFRTAFE